MKSKKKALFIHTSRRLSERFGVKFNSQQIKDMAAMCKARHYICHLGHESLMKSKMVIKFNNQIIPVIYDKKRHCIITVLTVDMLSKKEQEQLNLSFN